MNDSDSVNVVRGQEALTARRPNGARVARSLGSAGAARRPTLVRADTARCARGCRPLVRREKLRFSLRPRGAAQLAPRWASR
jgi:hypothetical protein